MGDVGWDWNQAERITRAVEQIAEHFRNLDEAARKAAERVETLISTGEIED